MVSITGVSAGQASHYYSKTDNYYTKEVGQWSGEGAKAMGLAGGIEKKDFEKLLYGRDKDGNQLVGAGVNGEHRAGIDLTFSAPKSVSILSEVVGDDKTREAHERAVETTLKHIEEHYAQARLTNSGQTERINTGNLVIAKFVHDTSRELDPQLHTHSVILNMTQREDGQWRALSNEELYANKMYFGQYYRNELAANLKELGHQVESDQRGLFEVAGIDKSILDGFSRRSEQIEKKIQEIREKYPHSDESKLREIAALGSRTAKQDVDKEIVRQSWNERLQEHGQSRFEIRESAHKAAEASGQMEYDRNEPKFNEYDYIRIATKDITENESTFSKEGVLKIAGRLSVGEYRVSELDMAFNELKRDKEIRQLDQNIYTTKEILKIEKTIVEQVRLGYGKADPITTREMAQNRLQEYENTKRMDMPNYGLTDDQRKAAEHILTSADRYIGIQGDAGTGKSTMMDAVRDQAEREGYEVKGFAKTGKAVDELQKNAAIRSQTIDSFLVKPEESSTNKQLWVIDEASELGSRQTKEILIRAEAQKAKVLLVGDVKQEQSISAGAPFQRLQESGVLRTVEMHEITRQSGDYKLTTQDLASKKIDNALRRLDRKDKIHELSNRNERMAAIVRDYSDRSDYKNTVIVTARNQDRNELNYAIRQELKSQGRLKGKERTFIVRESKNLSPVERHFAQSFASGDIVYTSKAGVMGRAGSEGKVTNSDFQNHKIAVQAKDGNTYSIDLVKDGEHLSVWQEKEQSFSERDRIVFLKNDSGLKVKNGQSATLRHIDELGQMRIKMDGGAEISLNVRSQYNYFDHGYAVTSYKAQGMTAKDAIYHADTSKEVNYNQAYVAMTRGRQDLTIYTDSKSDLKDQMKTASCKTWSLDHASQDETDRGLTTPTDKTHSKDMQADSYSNQRENSSHQTDAGIQGHEIER